MLHPPEFKEGVDSLVVYTREGAPVVVATEMDGQILVALAGDDDFERLMGSLGFTRAELPENVRLKAPR
jgi:hypothetical protein